MNFEPARPILEIHNGPRPSAVQRVNNLDLKVLKGTIHPLLVPMDRQDDTDQSGERASSATSGTFYFRRQKPEGSEADRRTAMGISRTFKISDFWPDERAGECHGGTTWSTKSGLGSLIFKPPFTH